MTFNFHRAAHRQFTPESTKIYILYIKINYLISRVECLNYLHIALFDYIKIIFRIMVGVNFSRFVKYQKTR